jgi:response regulator RpfG family c-di-GMP phosphodiesterase
LKGKHFDPEIVEAFIAIEAEFNRVRKIKLKEETAYNQQRVQAAN